MLLMGYFMLNNRVRSLLIHERCHSGRRRYHQQPEQVHVSNSVASPRISEKKLSLNRDSDPKLLHAAPVSTILA